MSGCDPVRDDGWTWRISSNLGLPSLRRCSKCSSTHKRYVSYSRVYLI